MQAPPLPGAALPGLEIVRFTESRHSYPRHSHDFYTVGLMERGANDCLGDKRDIVATGALAVINPGRTHTGAPLPGVASTYTMFYAKAAFMRRAALELGMPDADPAFARVVLEHPAARAALWRLQRAVAAGGERLFVESQAVAAFSLLLCAFGARRRPLSAGSEPRAVRLAREMLDAALETPVALEDLAAQAGLSRFHLLRVFKAAAGQTPHAYHLCRRVDAARGLLRGGLPIAEAAQRTGFHDQSHFTRTFKRYVGLTPGRYLAGGIVTVT